MCVSNGVGVCMREARYPNRPHGTKHFTVDGHHEGLQIIRTECTSMKPDDTNMCLLSSIKIN